MGDFKHIRNGVEISEPRNWDQLKISRDFRKNSNGIELDISEMEFYGDVGKDIRKRALSGLNGGVGVYEGDSYDIEVINKKGQNIVFNGLLDYSAGFEFIGCDGISVQLKQKQGGDWLNEVADGFSFRYLKSIGVINSSHEVKVPYIINYIPDGSQVVIISISLFMMSKELIKTTRDLSESIGDVTDASTPVLGVSLGIGAGAVTAYDIGNYILVAIKLAAWIAYIIFIVIAIKKLIEEIIDQFIQKKRFHLGMYIYDLFERACFHLNMTLKSSLLTSRKAWVLIPSKNHKGGEEPEDYVGNWYEQGVPSATDPFDTFGDLIRVWSEVFNADYRIVNGEFIFERKDFFGNVGNFKLKDYFTDQDNLIDRYSPNVEDMISNYNINWLYDTQDQNTMANQSGRVFQAIIEPNVVIDKDLVSMTGLREVSIPCSMGLRKERLTKVESVLKEMGKLVDKLTGVLGGGTNYASKVEKRKGSLLMSSHFLTIPKIVVMSGSKLAANQRLILGSSVLWDDLHNINSFDEVNGKHNQWNRRKGVKVQFCIDDAIELLSNNLGRDSQGRDMKVDWFEWNVWEDFATIDYSINEKHSDNFKTKHIRI